MVFFCSAWNLHAKSWTRKHRSLFFSSIVRFNATHEYLLIFFYSNFSFYFLIRYDKNTLHFKKKFFVYSNADDHMIELIIDTYYSKYYSINIIKVFFFYFLLKTNVNNAFHFLQFVCRCVCKCFYSNRYVQVVGLF